MLYNHSTLEKGTVQRNHLAQNYHDIHCHDEWPQLHMVLHVHTSLLTELLPIGTLVDPVLASYSKRIIWILFLLSRWTHQFVHGKRFNPVIGWNWKIVMQTGTDSNGQMDHFADWGFIFWAVRWALHCAVEILLQNRVFFYKYTIVFHSLKKKSNLAPQLLLLLTWYETNPAATVKLIHVPNTISCKFCQVKTAGCRQFDSQLNYRCSSGFLSPRPVFCSNGNISDGDWHVDKPIMWLASCHQQQYLQSHLCLTHWGFRELENAAHWQRTTQIQGS